MSDSFKKEVKMEYKLIKETKYFDEEKVVNEQSKFQKIRTECLLNIMRANYHIEDSNRQT